MANVKRCLDCRKTFTPSSKHDALCPHCFAEDLRIRGALFGCGSRPQQKRPSAQVQRHRAASTRPKSRVVRPRNRTAPRPTGPQIHPNFAPKPKRSSAWSGPVQKCVQCGQVFVTMGPRRDRCTRCQPPKRQPRHDDWNVPWPHEVPGGAPGSGGRRRSLRWR